MNRKNTNRLENRSIKLARELVAQSTNFDVEMQKLFYIILASAAINYDLPLKPSNAIALKKSDVFEKLNIKDNDRHHRYKELLKKLMKMSYFDFGNDENFESGYLFYHVSGNRYYWYIFVNDMYLPIIKNLSSNYVQLLLDDTLAFNSRFTMMLYQNLLSLKNEIKTSNGIYRKADYTTKQLKTILGLEKNDYMRKDGTFNRNQFENKTIVKAVNEINQFSQLITDLSWYKEYAGRNVERYVFIYRINDIDNCNCNVDQQFLGFMIDED